MKKLLIIVVIIVLKYCNSILFICMELNISLFNLSIIYVNYCDALNILVDSSAINANDLRNVYSGERHIFCPSNRFARMRKMIKMLKLKIICPTINIAIT